MTATGVTTHLDLERQFAVDAVVAASRLTRAVREGFDPSATTAKADRSPVTVADLGAQALVSMALATAFPTDGLMGEEDSNPLAASDDLAHAVLARVQEQHTGTALGDVREALERGHDRGGPGRRWWALDPVDGTKGFLRNEQYAVALALIEDGEVVLAAMACPNLPLLGEPGTPGPVGGLFVAEKGAGAWQRPLDDPTVRGRRIEVAAPRSPAEGRYAESVEEAHSDQADSARIGQRLGISSPPLRLDSQAKYALVARGDASIYLRLPRADYRENMWDHAAGWLIVHEAGGRVSDVEGCALDFTTGRRMTTNRGIVATAASIHAEVVAAVRSVLA